MLLADNYYFTFIFKEYDYYKYFIREQSSYTWDKVMIVIHIILKHIFQVKSTPKIEKNLHSFIFNEYEIS